MTPAKLEALHIARYALVRVIDVLTDDEQMPNSLYDAIRACVDEIEEYIPVGDLGEQPVTLILGRLREAKSRALSVHAHSAADAIDEARTMLVLANEEGRL
jgi:hypothetical protein